MAFTAWVITPPTPDYHQFLHSSNARDERGNLKMQTNNVFAWARDDTDLLCDKARNARTEKELSDATIKLQHIMHDEAIFVPAYKTDFMRIGSWRWLRWPDSEQTRFCVPVVYEPFEAHVHWIDDEMKKETLEAKRNGKTFPEVNRIFDDYRIIPGAEVPEQATEEEGEAGE
jgi:microcin C transport system substrate-binding protein